MGQRGKVKGSMDSPYEMEANASEELEQDGRNRRKDLLELVKKSYLEDCLTNPCKTFRISAPSVRYFN